ncbi:MAG TPA: hypothetical protein VD860_15300 [Azospirillum sp.]|nr:hypothetical protein [Azospirillum sp.]
MPDSLFDGANGGLVVTAVTVIAVTVYMWWRGALPLASMLATVAFAAMLAGVMVTYL